MHTEHPDYKMLFVDIIKDFNSLILKWKQNQELFIPVADMEFIYKLYGIACTRKQVIHIDGGLFTHPKPFMVNLGKGAQEYVIDLYYGDMKDEIEKKVNAVFDSIEQKVF